MPLIEVIVTSVADAVAAAAGGAGRLEVVRALDEEGLTPPLELVRAVAAQVEVPLRVMVRARNTFEVASSTELDALCAAASEFAAVGVDGIVCGFVRDGDLDLGAMTRVAAACAPCRITVHRAFEATRDPMATLALLARLPQVDRVLATGGAGAWPARLSRLRACVEAAPPGVGVLPGGGVDVAAVRVLARMSPMTEAHVGRAAREPPTAWGPVSAARVAALVAAWDASGPIPGAYWRCHEDNHG